MQIIILHDNERQDRMRLLKNEMEIQKITDYMIFPAIKHTIAATGISRAHKNAVGYALENNLDEICIMEDDVKFCGIGAFDFFVKNKPDIFSIYLSGIYFGKIMEDNTVIKFAGLHCYIAHHSFYEKILKMPESKHIDLGMAGMGRFVVCNPFAAIQHTTFSDNKKQVKDYTKLLQGRKLYTQ